MKIPARHSNFWSTDTFLNRKKDYVAAPNGYFDTLQITAYLIQILNQHLRTLITKNNNQIKILRKNFSTLDSDKTYLAGQSEPKLHVGYSTNQWNNQMPEHNPNLGNTSSNRQREYDPEDPLGPEVKGFEFTEKSIRRGFIRKVYAILSVSMIFFG